jgi:hypothetical protein
MTTTKFKLGTLAMALAGCALVTAPAAAESTGDQWTFALTPYLWLPNINGSLKYDLPSISAKPEVETGPNDYLENLDMAFMISGEARTGKWSVFTDYIYLDFGDENSRVKSFGGTIIDDTVAIDLGTKSSLSGSLWTLVGGYAVVQDPGATLDVIGGFRYLGIEAKTDWNLSATISSSGETLAASGSISEDGDLWDGIIGVRGHVKLGGSNWVIPYYADIGAGDSDLTWQAMAGITYNWNWGGVSLVYRHLSYDMDSDKLLQDVEFSGPALGATFRF